MNRDASGYGGELVSEADKANHRAVSLEPCSSTTWTPALLAGGLVGNGQRSGKQILDTHEAHIAIADREEKGARRSERLAARLDLLF
jgi:hypothetical protein